MNENTGEVREIALFNIMDGSVMERAEIALGDIARNMLDLNTDAKKPRTLTIKYIFTPTEDRRGIHVDSEVTAKLAPMRKLSTTLLLGGTEADPVIMEYSPQTPGQLHLTGGVQDEPKVIQLAKRA